MDKRELMFKLGFSIGLQIPVTKQNVDWLDEHWEKNKDEYKTVGSGVVAAGTGLGGLGLRSLGKGLIEQSKRELGSRKNYREVMSKIRRGDRFVTDKFFGGPRKAIAKARLGDIRNIAKSKSLLSDGKKLKAAGNASLAIAALASLYGIKKLYDIHNKKNAKTSE